MYRKGIKVLSAGILAGLWLFLTVGQGSASNFTHFDRVLMGVSGGKNEAQTYASTNIVTYVAENNWGKIRPSLDIGLLEYEAFDINDIQVGKNFKPIIDFNFNIIEAGELVPALEQLAGLIPPWVLVGGGISAEWDEAGDDIHFNGKWVVAVQVEVGK